MNHTDFYWNTSNHVYYVGYDSIAVLEGSTLEWLAEIPNIWVENPSTYDIAINQTTGQIYVIYSDDIGETCNAKYRRYISNKKLLAS